MRPAAVLTAALLAATTLLPQALSADESDGKAIAEVLGREITAAEASRLDGIILGALLERFAIDNDVEPSEHEIQAFISRTAEQERRHQARLERDRVRLRAELQDTSLGEQQRREKQEQLETIESILQTTRDRRVETRALADQLARINRDIARKFVRSWKINKALYDRYGGRVIFQQVGPEPVDAYRDFLREQQQSGAFRILDKRYEARFWRYFTHDVMHNFYPEHEGARFMETPWWLQEPPPEQ